MALLKSAWEIALEKTEGIEADPAKIKRDMMINEGRRLAGSYLTDPEEDGTQLEKAYVEASEEDRKLLRLGLAATVVLNVALPQSDEYEERIAKMRHIAQVLDGKESTSVQLLGQIGQFMGKYLQARDSLLERAKQQYEPMYEDKKERMMQKYGKASNLPLDQDPEFLQLLQKSYNQLSSQYQQVLDQAKEQLKSTWKLEL